MAANFPHQHVDVEHYSCDIRIKFSLLFKSYHPINTDQSIMYYFLYTRTLDF